LYTDRLPDVTVNCGAFRHDVQSPDVLVTPPHAS
jgi:hypothetical protein